MKKFIILFSMGCFSVFFAQEKKHILSGEHVLKGIQPEVVDQDSWVVVYKSKTEEKTIKASATPLDYIPQSSGFKLDPTSGDYFYVAYQSGGVVSYITEKQHLRKFMGKIDSGEEAAIIGILDGYFYDAEFKDLAGNYIDNGSYYTLEMGKVTGEHCPYKKNHYIINVDKTTGNLTINNDLGVYMEVYDKTCENNPHNQVIKDQMEEAKIKQQEKDLEAKKMREAMKRKQRKQMRRD